MKIIYMGLWLLLVNNAVYAELYRWTDADGQIHYSQVKPNQQPNIDALDIRTKYKKTETVNKIPQSTTTAASKTPDPKEDLSQLTPAQLKQRNCQKALAYSQSLQHKGKIAVTDADGKLKTLSKSERETKLQKARSLSEQYCAESKTESD